MQQRVPLIETDDVQEAGADSSTTDAPMADPPDVSGPMIIIRSEHGHEVRVGGNDIVLALALSAVVLSAYRTLQS
jgi:hypothetical protein